MEPVALRFESQQAHYSRYFRQNFQLSPTPYLSLTYVSLLVLFAVTGFIVRIFVFVPISSLSDLVIESAMRRRRDGARIQMD
jgi:hypothetical protein